MRKFLKVQMASVAGSLADYGLTILLVEVFHTWYLIANLAGNICGGTAQFILCRNWALKKEKNQTHIQIFRFIIFFAGNLLLSAAGIYFFTHVLKINYLISKTITSIALGLTYNYWMQKEFVFQV